MKRFSFTSFATIAVRLLACAIMLFSSQAVLYSQVTVSPLNGSICSGSDVSLTITGGTAPYTITYYIGGNQNVVTTPAVFTNPFKIKVVNPFSYNTTFSLSTVTDNTFTYLNLSGFGGLQIYQKPSVQVALATGGPLCSTQGVSFSNLGGQQPFSVQLADGSTNWNLSPVTNSSSVFYLPGGISFTGVSVTDANNCSAPFAGNYNIMLPALTLNTSGTVSATCNYTITLQNPLSGYTYAWYKDGTAVSGSSTPYVSGTVSFTATQTGNYYVIALPPMGNSGPPPCLQSSGYVHVTITSSVPAPVSPSVSVAPAGALVCGQTATLTANGPAYDAYTWRKNGVVIQTGPSSSYSAITSGIYDVAVTDNSKICSTSAFSSGQTVSFAPPAGFQNPVITSTANVIDCGQTAVLSVPSTYDTYQWQLNKVDIAGATSSSYSAAQGGSYTVKVTSGTCANAITSAFTLNVNSLPSPLLNKLYSFSIAFNSGLNTLSEVSSYVYDTYQWQRSVDATTYTDIAGATLRTYTFTEAAVFYRLKVTKGICVAYSNYAYPTITPPALSPDPYTSNGPVIMCASNAAISSPSGYASYQWFKNTVLLPGETTPVLDLSKPSLQSGAYSVLITDTYGLTGSSNTLTVTVLSDITPSLSTHNPSCSGESGTIQIIQSAPYAHYKNYVWKNPQGVILYSSTGSNPLPSIDVTNAGTYTLDVTDYAGCSATASATIGSATGTPSFTPVLQSNVTSLCFSPGPGPLTGIQISVSNISALPAGNYLYSWYLNGQPINTVPIQGMPMSPLGGPAFNALQGGTYTLQITEVWTGYPSLPMPNGWHASSCIGLSNALDLLISTNPRPNVTAAFTTANHCPGAEVKVTYNGSAEAGSSFTWNFGPGAIVPAGTTGAGPHLISYSTGGNKNISVTVTSGVCPAVTSPVFGLYVTMPVPLTVTAAPASIYNGCTTQVTLTGLSRNSPDPAVWSPALATAPLPGQIQYMLSPAQTTTYTVTAPDYNNCSSSGTVTITVSPRPKAYFHYPKLSYCTDVYNVSPVLDSGAVNMNAFTASNSGLRITTNGIINPGNSIPGTYIVTNTVNDFNHGMCTPVTATTTVTIEAKPPIPTSFDYGYNGIALCTGSGTKMPRFSGPLSTGTYTASPAGLDLNPVTGQLTLANCVPSLTPYTITYTVPVTGACSNVANTLTTTVYISQQRIPDFVYPQNAYCLPTGIISPVYQNGGSAGQFSSSSINLNVNGTTGAINLNSVLPGVYTITNTFYANSSCPQVSKAFTLTLSTRTTAGTFSYSKNVFCEGEMVNLSPVMNGSKGTFSVTPSSGITLNAAGVLSAVTTAGTYTVTNFIAGNPGCPDTQTSYVLTVNPKPATIISGTDFACSGVSYTPAALSNTLTGTTFTWTSPAVAGVTGNSSNTTGAASLSQVLSGTGTVTYTITPKLGTCVGSVATVTTTLRPVPSVTVSNKTICSGQSVQTTLTSTVPASIISWTASATSGTVSGFSSGSGTQINDILTGSGVVTYQITNSLNGCSSSASFAVTVNPSPAVITSGSESICSGTLYTPSALSGTIPGTIFTWTSPSATGVSGNSSNTTGASTISQTLTGNGTVAYTILPKLGTCTGTAAVITTTVKPLPTLSISNKSICTGQSVLTTLTSTVPASLVSWTASATSGTVSGFSSGSGTQISDVLTGSGAVTYQIINSLNGCSSSYSFVVTVNPLPVITVSAPVTDICQLDLLTYSYTMPSGSSMSISIPNGLFTTITSTGGSVGGSYTLRGKDSGTGTIALKVTNPATGCFSTDTKAITVRPVPVVTASSVTICEGAAFTIPVTVSGPASVLSWTATSTGNVSGFPASGTTAPIAAALNAISGNGVITYTITAAGSNGCNAAPKISTVTVNPNAPHIATVSAASPLCAGSGVTFSVSTPVPGYSYTYTYPAGFIFLGAGGGINGFGSSYTATSPGGDFTLTSTSTLGCVRTSSYPVVVNPTPVVTVPPAVSVCSGAAFDIPVTVSDPAAVLSWSATSTGTVSGFPVSGTTAHIAAGANSITGSGTITYTVTASSALNCSSVPKTIVVTVNPPPAPSGTVSSALVCEGSTVAFSVSTLPGITYTYTIPAGFSYLGGGGGPSGFGAGYMAGSTGGKFILTAVNNTSGCTTVSEYPVAVNPAPTVIAAPVSICDGGSFSIPLSSNDPLSTYAWSTSSAGTGFPSSGTANPISAAGVTGTAGIVYTVFATNSLGCRSWPQVVTVTVNQNPDHQVVVSPTTVCSGAPLFIAVETPAGYSYTYTAPPGFTLAGTGSGQPSGFRIDYLAGTASGAFAVTSTSASGCVKVSTYPVTVNLSPPAPVIDYGPDVCAGAHSGWGYAIEDGVEYSSYSDPGLIIQSGRCGQNETHYSCQAIWGNAGGLITVTGTAANGCSTTTRQYIPVQATPFINPLTLPDLCSGNTIIPLTTTPNHMAVNYTWQGFVGSGTINGQSSGAIISSGSVYTAPGYGYTINDALSGTGSVFYTVTATSQINGCSNQALFEETLRPYAAPSVTVSYSPHTSIPHPDQIVFTAAAVNCGPNPFYQWKVNGVNSGTNAPTYQNATLRVSNHTSAGDMVTCTVTSSDDCSNGVQATSNPTVLSCAICKSALTDDTVPAISTYPNPFETSFTLLIPADFGDQVEISIISSEGNEIERMIRSDKTIVLGEDYASGLYFIQIISGSRSELIKVVKTK